MIRFKLATNTHIGLVRSNNEDNFQAAADLTDSLAWVNEQEYDLGENGALMVIADGMGGMNAGEVASQIAVDTVCDCFAPERITPQAKQDRGTVEQFMRHVITMADERIKQASNSNSELRGMGTTIVLAWLLGNHVYIAWCGDSRAYVYNPAYGLRRLTKDHSYVQALVDRGTLTDDEAFDFPQNNIVTRSLGDSESKAISDCLPSPHLLCDNDVIMLCTDGLCGLVRDKEIEAIIAATNSNMLNCVQHLTQAALDNGGHDNVTICACRIISGGAKASKKDKDITKDTSDVEVKKTFMKRKMWIIAMIVALLSALACFGIFVFGNHSGRKENQTGTKENQIQTPLPQEKDNEREPKINSADLLPEELFDEVTGIQEEEKAEEEIRGSKKTQNEETHDKGSIFNGNRNTYNQKREETDNNIETSENEEVINENEDKNTNIENINKKTPSTKK